MPSMFSEYVKEKFGDETIENEMGFLTFNDGAQFYIKEIYVKPEFRSKEHAKAIAEKAYAVAVLRGYKEVLGSVSIQSKTKDKALSIFLKQGFEVIALKGEMIILKKRL